MTAGVREWAVAAGARNSPLLAALSAHPGLRLWRFVDERSLGFFALGRAMVTGQPVGLCVTSGTAAAELLPALIEAHYQGITLLALTADRPRSHRGRGTPQAITQPGLFGEHAPTIIDWQDDETFPDIDWSPWLKLRRPLHVNLSFSEPLLVEKFPAHESVAVLVPPSSDEAAKVRLWQNFVAKGEGIVLASGISPEESGVIEAAVRATGWPVVAEVTANFGPGFARGEDVLQTWNGRRVLRVGAVPVWRWWRDLEDKPEIEVLSVSRSGYAGLARACGSISAGSHFWRSLPGCEKPRPPTARSSPREKLLDRYPASEPALFRALVDLVPNSARVYWGNSMALRMANLTAGHHLFHSYASRGVNGIDGQCSTGFGISADATETWTFLGDLTAMYDPGAGWILDQLPMGKRRMVVMNNDGGGIFQHLKDLAAYPDQARVFLDNPHGKDFKRLADYWECDYVSVNQAADAERLKHHGAERLVIEARPDAAETAAFWKDWRADG